MWYPHLGTKMQVSRHRNSQSSLEQNRLAEIIKSKIKKGYKCIFEAQSADSDRDTEKQSSYIMKELAK